MKFEGAQNKKWSKLKRIFKESKTAMPLPVCACSG